MQNCTKYKSTLAIEGHHNNPKGSCESCVYFTKLNCGEHLHNREDVVAIT